MPESATRTVMVPFTFTVNTTHPMGHLAQHAPDQVLRGVALATFKDPAMVEAVAAVNHESTWAVLTPGEKS